MINKKLGGNCYMPQLCDLFQSPPCLQLLFFSLFLHSIFLAGQSEPSTTCGAAEFLPFLPHLPESSSPSSEKLFGSWPCCPALLLHRLCSGGRLPWLVTNDDISGSWAPEHLGKWFLSWESCGLDCLFCLLFHGGKWICRDKMFSKMSLEGG